ncbi:MAG TPA: ATP synthase F0 subunit C [Oligoflexia bacterium]|nr:ATP synthase F0 subunit C [Oligoflexia bacterium]HMP48118.1 ATP synthase F0 subunit C [Oligoflexia bacterium]
MKGLKYLAGALITNVAFASAALADEAVKVVASSGGEILSTRAVAALAMGIAVFGASNAQGKAIAAAVDSIGRNPGAAGQMFLPWILALVFIESLVLFTLVIAFQII